MGESIAVILHVVILTSMSAAAHQVFYVLPDNSTNASCSLQPCATLSQYLLDNNGSLPVMSNVEYHFLPGEHHVPINMTLQYLRNFTIIGSSINKSILFIDLQAYVKICDSIKFSISNVVFKAYEKRYEDNDNTCNVILSNCFSCAIINTTFLHYGICGENLNGTFYLSNVVVDFTLHCYTGIYLHYGKDSQTYHHIVIIDGLLMFGNGYTYCTSRFKFGFTGLNIMSHKVVNNTYIVKNSQFQSMGQPIINIMIVTFTNGICSANSRIWIENCTFQHNNIRIAVITVRLSHYNVSVTFSNCQFYMNDVEALISVEMFDYYDVCEIELNVFDYSQSITNLTNLTFINNAGSLLTLVNQALTPYKSTVFIGNIYMDSNLYYNSEGIYIANLNIYVNEQLHVFFNHGHAIMSVESSDICFNGLVNISSNIPDDMMIFKSSNVLFNGMVKISHNMANNLMIFHSSDVLFNGPMTISNNAGSVMQMSSCNITFNGSVNIYDNYEYDDYFCKYIMQFTSCNMLFSKDIFISSNICKMIIIINSHRESSYIKVMEYSNIALTQNNCSNVIAVEINSIYNNPYPFCLFQYVTLQNISTVLPSHYTIIISDSFLSTCKLSFYYFLSHCQWIPTAVFHNHKPEAINHQIIQLNHKLLHSTIFYCSNFSTDTVGPVYPGQLLQLELCMPCSDDYSVLYAEAHNANLPKSVCKIADQTELVNFITNNSRIFSYTIVSAANNSCELFLTVSPFLYYIYEVFDVQLLPCPIGFTLQNGVCDCDPLLPTDIDTCYIDQSAIRLPANTWISYTQSGTSTYLISDCPMDYCLPFSSNINLIDPDTQCQFNRTGILCSQCQHSLSMVFGSSRCMKCTNVHILITIIVIAAGIVLVVLLYLLNLTISKGTISGMILYVNIISINDSVFLVHDNMLSPLRLFIAFLNLDLGIETCFYNGMDGYVKMWLQLFFPIYLMIIAFSIIITSRYSPRILRLTYMRSLPVLAILFLLSYTGVLRTVLTVLFSYSNITHLPSGHQKLVWSVDASVSLFGLKFTILFITCLVLFLILLFFNIILLFTRCLARFKLINHFKPILDAFQGSYKDRYYYWIAVHIILRSLFFVLYAFQTNVRLVSATMILVLFTGCFGYIHPNKIKLVNFHELLLLVNLTIMHVAAIQTNHSIFYIATNFMVGLAFVQLIFIVLCCFFTYTCHCNIENTLKIVKERLAKCYKNDNDSINVSLLDIPERTYNYSEYQDGLVSDDFTPNR